TGDLARHGRQVVAGSTNGVVSALRPTRQGPGVRWQRRLPGGVYKAPAFTADGDRVLVGSTDHRLYALDAGDGRTAWTTTLSAPVMSDLARGRIGAADVIFVAAGHTLYCLDQHRGARRWQTELGGPFVGLAAFDGRRVFAGSGDGHVYGLDAGDGSVLWRTSVTGATDAYHR